MNKYINQNAWIAATLLGWAMMTSSTQAASFDCAKAATKVEKLVCADAGLSKLDEELNADYKTALQKYGQAKTTKVEQAQWIKDRNSCESNDCLKALYQARLQELNIEPAQFIAMPPALLVDTSDKPVFDNETDKLKFMQYIANQYVFEPTKLTANKEFCRQFFEDFTKDVQLEAVEPDVRAYDEQDPRLDKWHRCEDKEILPDGFDYLLGLGGPPFRYYQIEVDGKPDNGKEDIIYTDYRKADSGGVVGHNSYHWVDLEKCKVMGGGIVTSLNPLYPHPPNIYHLNSIVKYKDSYLTVDLSPLGRPAYNLQVSPMDVNLVGQLCLWLPKNE
ncbi:MAG: lysozyme inhibitor LprI family protein [Gallionella sp.]